MCHERDTGVVWSLGEVVSNADSNRLQASTLLCFSIVWLI
jgi:hypothetical protein